MNTIMSHTSSALRRKNQVRFKKFDPNKWRCLQNFNFTGIKMTEKCPEGKGKVPWDEEEMGGKDKT